MLYSKVTVLHCHLCFLYGYFKNEKHKYNSNLFGLYLETLYISNINLSIILFYTNGCKSRLL